MTQRQFQYSRPRSRSSSRVFRYHVLLLNQSNGKWPTHACKPLFPIKLVLRRPLGICDVIRMECEKSSFLIGPFVPRDRNTRFWLALRYTAMLLLVSFLDLLISLTSSNMRYIWFVSTFIIRVQISYPLCMDLGNFVPNSSESNLTGPPTLW